MANMLTMPPSKAVAALTPKESGTSPLPPAAPKPAANALATNAMGNTAMTPQKSPYAAAAAPKPQSLVNGAIDGFMRGFRPEQWQADQDKTKLDGAERAKKTLALMQQQRQIPAEQRAQWWQQNADQIGQIVGADVKSLPMDANSFTDQALDGQIAMMSAKLGIAPEKPEPMSAYQAAQIAMEKDKLGRPTPYNLGDGAFAEYDPSAEPDKRLNMIRQPTTKPVQKEYDYKEVGNRVIAINKNDPSDRIDVGPVKPTGSGSGSGLTPYQEMQSQFKIDDTAREVSAAAQKGRASLQTLDNSIALLDKFTGDTAKFNAVYGNGMNPTGKKDDLFNWSIGMDDNRKDGMAMLDQLGGQAFIDSIRDMKSAGGAGSLSDAEGSKLATAATRLMTVNQTDASAKEAADEFRLRLTRFRNFLEQDMAAIQEAEQRRSAQLQTMMGRAAPSPQQSPTQQASAPIDTKVVQNPAMKMAIRAYAQQTGMPADAITEFLSNPATPQEIAEFNGAFGAGKAEAILKAMQNGR